MFDLDIYRFIYVRIHNRILAILQIKTFHSGLLNYFQGFTLTIFQLNSRTVQTVIRLHGNAVLLGLHAKGKNNSQEAEGKEVNIGHLHLQPIKKSIQLPHWLDSIFDCKLFYKSSTKKIISLWSTNTLNLLRKLEECCGGGGEEGFPAPPINRLEITKKKLELGILLHFNNFKLLHCLHLILLMKYELILTQWLKKFSGICYLNSQLM